MVYLGNFSKWAAVEHCLKLAKIAGGRRMADNENKINHQISDQIYSSTKENKNRVVEFVCDSQKVVNDNNDQVKRSFF